MCQVLKVSRSGYYEWRGRPLSERSRSNEALDREIKTIFDDHRQRYGSPRIVDELKDRGIECGGGSAYRRLIQAKGLRCSMGRRANCYDNAVMESFFHTLKVEFVHRQRFTSRDAARQGIFEYIENYYNRQRKHSAIGYQIPMLMEQTV